MKKIIASLLLCVFTSVPVFGNIHIKPDTVKSVVLKHVESDKVNACIREYNDNIKASDGRGMAADRLWNVCAAAGWDIQDATGKAKCQNFVSELVGNSTIEYYAVCGKDKGKTGVTEYCIDDFFTNKFYGGTQVQAQSAIRLAMEYARIKHGDDSLVCNEKPYEIKVVLGATDWIVQCVSQNKNAAYEFVFDDIRESIDDTVMNNIATAVCRIHDTKGTGAGCSGGGTNVSGSMNCWKASCYATAQKCNEINVSVRKFGYEASFIDNSCQIDFKTVGSADKLRNDFKGVLDNFYFCSEDMNVNADFALYDAVSTYISQTAGVAKSAVECEDGFRIYTGKGCRSKYNIRDNIIRCSVGDRAIDLVFDDVTEAFKYVVRGGISGMQCRNSNGTFDGANCSALGEEQCNKLKESMKAAYPDAKDIYWDGKICRLPDAKAAQLTQQITEYTVKTGTEIVVVATVAASGGSALFIAGTAAAATGTLAKVVADGVMTFGLFDPFVESINACLVNDNDIECAKNIIRNDFQKYASYAQDFSLEQQNALDENFNRLFDRIPADDEIWESFFGNPEFWDCDKSGMNCSIKIEKQAWQKVRSAGHMLQIAGGIMQLVGNIGNMIRSVETINAKVVGNMNNKVNLLKHYNPSGTTGAIVANDVTKSWYGVTNSQLVKNMGWNVGDVVKLSNGSRVLVQYAVPNGMAAVEIMGAAAESNYETSKRSAPIIISKGKSAKKTAPTDESQPDVPVVVPGTDNNTTPGGDDNGNTPGGNNTQTVVPAVVPGTNTTPGGGNNTTATTGENKSQPDVPVVVPGADNNTKTNGGDNGNTPGGNNTQTVAPLVVPVANKTIDTTPVVVPVIGMATNNNTAGKTYTPTNNVSDYSDNENSDKNNKSRRNTGAIVAASVGGTIAAGALIGGIVVATGKKSESGKPALQRVNTDNNLDNLMNTAFGVLGVVDNRNIKLVPLPTVVNSDAPIVMINNRVVVVVGYNGYKLPFYLSNGTWAPLLGIGNIEYYFNVYPDGANSGIAKMDEITAILNRKLQPALINQYATANNQYGATFPIAAQSAFNIINSEFPNGVVQHANFTAADNKLYNDNYYLIKSKMK